LVFDENLVEGWYSHFNAVWLIDGKVFPKLAGRGWTIYGTPPLSLGARSKPFPIGAQDMTDLPARLADMDRLGIHYQVVFPTVFLTPLSEDPRLERALCESYNRFMAAACRDSGGRIRFAAAIPLRDMPDAIAVAEEAKALGAVAVMVPGLMLDNPLSDEQFYPLYEALSRLKLPLGVHVGWGSPSLTSIFSDLHNSTFSGLVMPVLMAFWSLMVGGVYERFPDLRVAFLEAGCEWLPFLVTQLERRYDRFGLPLSRRPTEYLRGGQIYLSCEPEENLAPVLQYLGEDYIVLASDYGHADASVEEDMIGALAEHQPQFTPATREKVLSTNALRLYDLPA